MNCFIFVRCSQVQKLLSNVKTLAYKSTAAVASALQKDQTATALLTVRKVHSAAFVSVVSAVCLVHFLTFVSNLSKSQITSRARFVSVVSVRVDTFRGVRFRCVKSSPVSGCKVITFLPHYQTILKKSFIKNCKRPNKPFLTALCGVCVCQP